jgi:hypothetical protein
MRFLKLKFSSVIAVLLECLSVTSVTFTGNQYGVSGGGMTSTVPVPADEFVISFSTSGPETFIYLLADDDIMTSDMIFIQFSSYNRYAGVCTSKHTYYNTLSLPYKQGRISRICSNTQIYYNYNVSTHLHFKV